MKNFSFARTIVAACGLSVAVFALSSCSSVPSAKMASKKISTESVKVFSYNDQGNLQARECQEVGALPDRARRALALYLRDSEKRNYNYTYPQYFISVGETQGRSFPAWALCTDGKGNFVGVQVTRGNRQAWNLSPSTSTTLYVNTTPERAELGKAILESLAEAGYDTYRLDARRSYGLTEDRYLISAPAAAPVEAPAPVVEEKKPAAPAPEVDEDEPSDEPEEDTEDDLDDLY